MYIVLTLELLLHIILSCFGYPVNDYERLSKSCFPNGSIFSKQANLADG